jgi:hypothetical protein
MRTGTRVATMPEGVRSVVASFSEILSQSDRKDSLDNEVGRISSLGSIVSMAAVVQNWSAAPED